MASKLIKLKYLLYEFLSLKQSIPVIAWLPKYSIWKIKTNNWGDDVSLELVRLITNCKVIPAQFRFSATKKINYSVIGSLIPWYIYDTTIVWGSGVKSPEIPFIRKPLKILAVRGPLTRKVLIENGLQCPEVYGDPALLFPLLYNPRKVFKYDIGIILHHSDLENSDSISVVESLKKKYNVFFINIQEYGNWKNFIDNICSCKYIISSSLHGLIIADAYGIPNIWGKFTYEFGFGRFKFHDYFLSVNRNVVEPKIIDKNIDLSVAFDELEIFAKPSIDILRLIDSCPFQNKLRQKYFEYIQKNKNSIYI